jgi:hypothetical protein
MSSYADPQMNREYNKAYRARAKAADPEYGRKLYSHRKKRLNSDKNVFVANKISKQKDAARRRNIEWTLDTTRLTKRLLNATYCAISGRELVFKIGHPNSPSIDRKNSKLGYTARNIQIVAYTANVAKMELSDRDFIQLCKDIAQYNS